MRHIAKALTVLLSLASSAVSVGQSERPNIVFAFADDLGRYASVYRDADRPSPNDLIATPAMDRLAREGAWFTNAFVSAPSCTPSRAAVVSGRHFFRNGSHAQLHHPWHGDEADPFDAVMGFPLLLQAAGYDIGWSYKLHIDPRQLGGAQSRAQSAGTQFNRFSGRVSRAADQSRERARLFEEVRANFAEFLGRRRDGAPFFYWFNPTNTHRPWRKGSGQALWGIDPDDLEGRLHAGMPDTPEIREDFADYLGEAMAFDASVAVLLAELEARALLDNTLVIVSGDHGAPGFPRGKCNLYDFGTRVPLMLRLPGRVLADRRIDTPVSLLDLAPTVLDAAGVSAPTDVPAETTAEFDGESLWPVLRGANPETLRGYAVFGRETHVDEARAGNLPYPVRGIRTADHALFLNLAPDRWPVCDPPFVDKVGGKFRRTDLDHGPTRTWLLADTLDPLIGRYFHYMFGKRPAVELYDMREDRHQVENLADSAAHAELRDALQARLLGLLTAAGDPRILDAAFDRPPYVAPAKPSKK